MSNLQTAQFWTKAESEVPRVKTFALIPDGWEGKLDQHPQSDQIFYWCSEQEWIALGAGEVLAGVEIITCACDECEFERNGDEDRA